MSLADRRLRMFAGPNGSGKSTVKSVINPTILGFYLNPDEIEKEVKERGYFDVRHLQIRTTRATIIDFFSKHPLLERTQESDFIDHLQFVQNEFIDFSNIGFNSYLSAILTDFLRYKLLEEGKSFTFETVMSSPDKIEFLKTARQVGFRNYLYFVATEDPSINIDRVKNRVRNGGHSVPEHKIVERYFRSLHLLFDAIKTTDRAYIFDNSGNTMLWIAEISNGSQIELKTEAIPEWFVKSVLNKL